MNTVEREAPRSAWSALRLREVHRPSILPCSSESSPSPALGHASTSATVNSLVFPSQSSDNRPGDDWKQKRQGCVRSLSNIFVTSFATLLARSRSAFGSSLRMQVFPGARESRGCSEQVAQLLHPGPLRLAHRHPVLGLDQKESLHALLFSAHHSGLRLFHLLFEQLQPSLQQLDDLVGWQHRHQ